MNDLDVSGNRSAKKYTKTEILRRIAWDICYPLFRFSPRPMFKWRCTLLRLFGARIGDHVHIYSSALIYMPWNLTIGHWSSIGELAYIYNLGEVRIGNNTTISYRAHLCAGSHDYRSKEMPLLKPPIYIEDNVWVCTDAFIGPGVTVGKNSIVGARAVIVKDVSAYDIVVGNPSRIVKQRKPK